MTATAGIANLSDLAKDIGDVEFKHTLGAGDDGRVPPVFRGALKPPQRRKVYFYDTGKLDLYNESRLILRARDAGRRRRLHGEGAAGEPRRRPARGS